MRLLILVLLLLPTVTAAQPARTLRLEVENDWLALKPSLPLPTDWDYTSGLAVVFETAAARPSYTTRRRWTLGQRLYTPHRFSTRPRAGDRPFAGWLYVGGRFEKEERHRVRAVEAEVGIVGPQAFGEETQNGFHRLLGVSERAGWVNQLPFEPGFAVRAEEARRFHAQGPAGVAVEVRPALLVGAGTIWSGVAAGTRVYVGPSHPRGWQPRAEAGVRGEWVLRNEFLDGTAFRESMRAERIPFVGEAHIGVSLGWGPVTAGYRVVARTREYEAQHEPHAYGALSLTVAF